MRGLGRGIRPPEPPQLPPAEQCVPAGPVVGVSVEAAYPTDPTYDRRAVRWAQFLRKQLEEILDKHHTGIRKVCMRGSVALRGLSAIGQERRLASGVVELRYLV